MIKRVTEGSVAEVDRLERWNKSPKAKGYQWSVDIEKDIEQRNRSKPTFDWHPGRLALAFQPLGKVINLCCFNL